MNKKVFRENKKEAYLRIISLVPLSLCILHIAYVMARKRRIHYIKMDNDRIQLVNRGLVIGCTHVTSQIEVLRKPNSFVELTELSRL